MFGQSCYSEHTVAEWWKMERKRKQCQGQFNLALLHNCSQCLPCQISLSSWPRLSRHYGRMSPSSFTESSDSALEARISSALAKLIELTSPPVSDVTEKMCVCLSMLQPDLSYVTIVLCISSIVFWLFNVVLCRLCGRQPPQTHLSPLLSCS